MTYNKENIPILMQGWTSENKEKLRLKMENKGISKGGILNTSKENTELYKYLIEGIKTMPNARDMLIKVAEEFQNNYLTAEKFADHNGLFDDDAKALIELAQKVRNRPNCHA